MLKIYNNNSLDIFYKIINENHDKKIIIVSDPPFNINYKYNTYLDNMDEDEYFEMLDFFFKDLPSVVIHYPEQLYKLSFQIGKFPERLKPISVTSEITDLDNFMTIKEISETLMRLNMSVYAPFDYILENKMKYYEDKYDITVKEGQSSFKQRDRERSSKILMRINFLKRLEMIL